MLEITVLGSGSSGNATLVRSQETSVLIDAGFSLRQITLRMDSCGWHPSKLDAILISHEHGDHSKGLRVLCAKYDIPVFAAEAAHGTRELREAQLAKTEVIEAGEEFSVGDLAIAPFSIPHDAADPLGFVIKNGGNRLGYATDLGYASALTIHHLRDCRLLVLESNHDPGMLVSGSYPWPVKQRILSRTGHLSNDGAATLLGEVASTELQAVVLAHISRENNTAQLALEAGDKALRQALGEGIPRVVVAGQDVPTETFRVE